MALFLLNDGASFILLNNGTDRLLLNESVSVGAYPAYAHRRRIQVQRADGTVTEVESESEAWTLLQSLALRAQQQVEPPTRKAVKAKKAAIKAADAVTYGPPVDLFAKIATPKAPVSEATFARMMRSAAIADRAMRDEEDVEMLLMAN